MVGYTQASTTTSFSQISEVSAQQCWRRLQRWCCQSPLHSTLTAANDTHFSHVLSQLELTSVAPDVCLSLIVQFVDNRIVAVDRVAKILCALRVAQSVLERVCALDESVQRQLQSLVRASLSYATVHGGDTDLYTVQSVCNALGDVLTPPGVSADPSSWLCLAVQLLVDQLSAGSHCLEVTRAAFFSVNTFLEQLSRECRSQLQLRLSEQLMRLVQMLDTCGDYDVQASIVECLMRVSSRVDRRGLAVKWFSDSVEMQQLFVSISSFDADCRLMLNALNKRRGAARLVHSFPSVSVRIGCVMLHKPRDPNYTELWVDISEASRTVMVYCDDVWQAGDSGTDSSAAGWSSLTMKHADIARVRLHLETQQQVLTLTMTSAWLSQLRETRPEIKLRTVNMMFHKNCDLHNVFGRVFPDKYRFESAAVSLTGDSKSSVCEFPVRMVSFAATPHARPASKVSVSTDTVRVGGRVAGGEAVNSDAGMADGQALSSQTSSRSVVSCTQQSQPIGRVSHHTASVPTATGKDGDTCVSFSSVPDITGKDRGTCEPLHSASAITEFDRGTSEPDGVTCESVSPVLAVTKEDRGTFESFSPILTGTEVNRGTCEPLSSVPVVAGIDGGTCEPLSSVPVVTDVNKINEAVSDSPDEHHVSKSSDSALYSLGVSRTAIQSSADACTDGEKVKEDAAHDFARGGDAPTQRVDVNIASPANSVPSDEKTTEIVDADDRENCPEQLTSNIPGRGEALEVQNDDLVFSNSNNPLAKTSIKNRPAVPAPRKRSLYSFSESIMELDTNNDGHADVTPVQESIYTSFLKDSVRGRGRGRGRRGSKRGRGPGARSVARKTPQVTQSVSRPRRRAAAIAMDSLYESEDASLSSIELEPPVKCKKTNVCSRGANSRAQNTTCGSRRLKVVADTDSRSESSVGQVGPGGAACSPAPPPPPPLSSSGDLNQSSPKSPYQGMFDDAEAVDSHYRQHTYGRRPLRNRSLLLSHTERAFDRVRQRGTGDAGPARAASVGCYRLRKPLKSAPLVEVMRSAQPASENSTPSLPDAARPTANSTDFSDLVVETVSDFLPSKPAQLPCRRAEITDPNAGSVNLPSPGHDNPVNISTSSISSPRTAPISTARRLSTETACDVWLEESEELPRQERIPAAVHIETGASHSGETLIDENNNNTGIPVTHTDAASTSTCGFVPLTSPTPPSFSSGDRQAESVPVESSSSSHPAWGPRGSWRLIVKQAFAALRADVCSLIDSRADSLCRQLLKTDE